MKIGSQFLLLASLMLVWIWTSAASAADPPAAEVVQASNSEISELTYSPQWPEPPNTGAMLVRLGLGTAVVLVLCVGSLWLAKPWLLKLQVGRPGSQLLQIEGSVALGSRAVLFLVKIGDTQLVAGTDATGLKSLVVVPSSFREVLDEQLPPSEPVIAAAQYFDARLPAIVGSKE